MKKYCQLHLNSPHAICLNSENVKCEKRFCNEPINGKLHAIRITMC